MRGEPSASCEWCSSSEASHSVIAVSARFETTAVLSRATISTSERHCGHHARIEVRPCRTRSDSVSMVIFVCFAITFALDTRPRACAASAPVKQGASCSRWRRKVLRGALKTSDKFSQPGNQKKTGEYQPIGEWK